MKRLWLASLIAAIALLVFLRGGQPTTDEALSITPVASAASRALSAAYVYDKAGLTFSDADAQNLDQLNFSFALFQNGRLSGSHWQSIGAFQAYIAKYPHIFPVLAIGGWGADGFSQAAATAEGRAQFASDAVALMRKHGFRGLDIDWEYPGSSVAGIRSSSSDTKNFTLLLQELRGALDALTAEDGQERRLCIAVGADASLVSKIEAKAVGALVDQVNVMTYDLHGSSPSHHTALYGGSSSADAAVQAYRAAGIPKSKIMLGAAFYGHRWNANKHVGTLTYDRIRGMLTAQNSFWDETAQAPYLIDGSSYISYDNARSIASKGAYVTQNGLMGMMCWEYGGDTSGALLSAMRTSMP